MTCLARLTDTCLTHTKGVCLLYVRLYSLNHPLPSLLAAYA